jgi:hypothetical protein
MRLGGVPGPITVCYTTVCMCGGWGGGGVYVPDITGYLFTSVYTVVVTTMSSIVSDDDVFLQFTNESSRKQYKRKWSDFVEFCGNFDLEAGQPGEELLSKYFKYLRNTKKMASSSLWTIYSCLNSIFKRKYSTKLQEMPRLTLLIKGFDKDVKQKAAIFDDKQLKEFMLVRKESAYWLVRQVITIVAFFGGLRIQECMDLVLEKIQRGKEGYFITHFRVKQRRSDKL